MSPAPRFNGRLGQREIGLIQNILVDLGINEEEMKRLFEDRRLRTRMENGLQEVREEIAAEKVQV